MGLLSRQLAGQGTVLEGQVAFLCSSQPATWSFLSCKGTEEGVPPWVLLSWKCPRRPEATKNAAPGSQTHRSVLAGNPDLNQQAVHVPECSATFTPFGTGRHSQPGAWVILRSMNLFQTRSQRPHAGPECPAAFPACMHPCLDIT